MTILTLPQALADYEAHERLRGMQKNTIQCRRHALTNFGRFWGDRDLREATALDIERYAEATLAKVKRPTAYQRLNSVKLLFRHLASRRLLLLDPAADLPMPKVHEGTLGRILSEAEVGKLLAGAANTPEEIRNRTILEFLYSTGLRTHEARAVKVADVGPDSVTVREGKGGRGRVVPLGATAKQWIDRYLAEARPISVEAGTEELFVTSRGRGFCQQWLASLVRKLGRAAGVEGVTIHTLRRTLATHLIANGAGAEAVSAILGHIHPGSISRYAKVVARDVQRTHEHLHPREANG